jgi:hypothetical protein
MGLELNEKRHECCVAVKREEKKSGTYSDKARPVPTESDSELPSRHILDRRRCCLHRTMRLGDVVEEINIVLEFQMLTHQCISPSLNGAESTDETGNVLSVMMQTTFIAFPSPANHRFSRLTNLWSVCASIGWV